MFTIIAAETDAHIGQAITLTKEYVDWLVATIQEQYPQLDITEMLSEHDYDDIRKKIPGDHVPPYGRLLLAMNGHNADGMIALGKLSDSICEMRTLYIRPEVRGTGIGKKLVETILKEAQEIGYSHMRLDTLGFMNSALGLYHSLGFRDIPPYRDVSDSLKQYIHFLELDLRK